MAEDNKDEISINLNCYLIRFRAKNIKDQYFTVKDGFRGKSFSQISQSLISFFDRNTHKNQNGDRILYLDKSLSKKDTYYSGILKKGYSGQESYVDEISGDNKAKTVNTILSSQFNSSPFYFLIAQPDVSSTFLIFLSQSYKQYGFKELFEDAFRKFYKGEVSEEYICEFSTLSIGSLFERYIAGGNIRKLRFKKHGLTSNAENVLSEDERKNKDNYSMELSITAKKEGFLGIKNNITAKDASFIETIKVDDFEYDQVFADVSFGGRKRVLNITKPEDFSASFDLTEKCDIDNKTKHPNFEKLDKEAILLLTEEVVPNIDL